MECVPGTSKPTAEVDSGTLRIKDARKLPSEGTGDMGSGQSTLVSTQESGGQEEDRVLEFSAETWWEGAFAQL